MELLEKNIIKIENTDSTDIIYGLLTSPVPPKEAFNKEVITILNTSKKSIEEVNNIKKWDYNKKLSNPFELINRYVKNKNLNLGIADYNSISRAFYKFWEILFDFDLIDKGNPSITYAALAEGPGGFVEAFNFYRRKYSTNNTDIINCITLKDTDNSNIPSWKKISGCNYNISWGSDGTGDLYKLENILYFSKLFDGNKADLVSADGGFDFSTDYTNQELSAQKLIFCEMITGLSILKNRGHMVIKIFDIFYSSTVEIIYILSLYFESVYITKPCTSRPANSEKYIVCKFFKGIDTNKLIELYKIVSEYNSLSGRLYISSFINRPIPDDFKNLIFSYNLYSVAKQLKYILKTNSYINAYLLNDDINNIKNSQCINSLAWCYKYDFDINKKSRYLNLDSKYNYIPNFV
tara:strand:+ start:13074 stop:14294 length:1221 start_codon:yes stop_codon:yes gene_type:complete